MKGRTSPHGVWPALGVRILHCVSADVIRYQMWMWIPVVQSESSTRVEVLTEEIILHTVDAHPSWPRCTEEDLGRSVAHRAPGRDLGSAKVDTERGPEGPAEALIISGSCRLKLSVRGKGEEDEARHDRAPLRVRIVGGGGELDLDCEVEAGLLGLRREEELQPSTQLTGREAGAGLELVVGYRVLSARRRARPRLLMSRHGFVDLGSVVARRRLYVWYQLVDWRRLIKR